MATPDLTPAQLVSALVALLGAAVVLFKLDLTQEQQAAFATAIGTIVPTAWLIADSIIRHGRASVVAAQHNLAAAQVRVPDAKDTAAS
jgi:hypothetical protein